jgi:hypothetical protein
MSHTSAVAALEVADEAFLVASTIERCPKTMMIRELVMNALEAATHAPSGRHLVEISPVQIDGVTKLAIWNTGPGMDASELRSICDIASSLSKEKSLTGNFGMGAKVASLPSNQFGMRYRSCKADRVHEVILCKRDGVYGRLRRRDQENGECNEVIDVTELAAKDGRSLDEEWTEVVLFGNDPDQDTVNDPYNGDPADLEKQWLATYLYHRFYRLPDDVKVTLLKGTNKLDGNRQFEPITARLRYFEKYETVEAQDGIRIHYLFDAPYNKETGSGHNQSIKGAMASAVSTAAIIYKEEMYDVRKGRNWTFDAPNFGIPFGAKHISVHIELPKEYPVVSEAYRRALQYDAGEQPQVQASDFANIVREHLPQWLIDVIRSFAPECSSNDEIRDELQKLLNDLRVRRSSPKVSPDGQSRVTTGSGPASDVGHSHTASGGNGEGVRHRPTDLSILPTGAKRADLYKNIDRAPEIKLLRDEADIEEKELKGRAARYYSESNFLFVNMRYPAIAEMKAQLEAEYASANDPELMRSRALEIAEKTMIRRVGRTVVFALAKQLNKEWDHKAVETASSPESLSMTADDFAYAMPNARRVMGKTFPAHRKREVPSSMSVLEEV